MNSTCDLCGHQGHDVRASVVVWREPVGQRYNAIDRCVDHAACRERVVMAGNEWPILEPIEVAALEPL